MSVVIICEAVLLRAYANCGTSTHLPVRSYRQWSNGHLIVSPTTWPTDRSAPRVATIGASDLWFAPLGTIDNYPAAQQGNASYNAGRELTAERHGIPTGMKRVSGRFRHRRVLCNFRHDHLVHPDQATGKVSISAALIARFRAAFTPVEQSLSGERTSCLNRQRACPNYSRPLLVLASYAVRVSPCKCGDGSARARRNSEGGVRQGILPALCASGLSVKTVLS